MRAALITRRSFMVPALSCLHTLEPPRRQPHIARPPNATSAEVFGARADGITDDAPAITRALQMGRPVWLTPGRRYLAKSPIEVPTGSQLSSDGTAAILRAADGPLLHMIGASRVEISGLELRGGNSRIGSATAAEVMIDWRSTGGSQISLSDLTIYGSPGAGILALASASTRSMGLMIRRCAVYNSGSHGVIAQDYIDQVLIEDCIVKHSGVRVSDRPGITASRNGRGVTIRNNICIGSPSAIGRSVHGISLDRCEDVLASGNICSGWIGYGIEVGGVKNGIVENNTLTDNVYGIAGSGLTERFKNNSVIIHNNNICLSRECGIYFFISDSTPNEFHHDITITKNTIDNVSGHSIGIGMLLNSIDCINILSNEIVGTSRSGIQLEDCLNIRIQSVSMRHINISAHAGDGGLLIKGPAGPTPSIAISHMSFEDVIGPKVQVASRPSISKAN